jgi:hypothetical protein
LTVIDGGQPGHAGTIEALKANDDIRPAMFRPVK